MQTGGVEKLRPLFFLLYPLLLAYFKGSDAHKA